MNILLTQQVNILGATTAILKCFDVILLNGSGLLPDSGIGIGNIRDKNLCQSSSVKV